MSPRVVAALDVETADAQHTRICSMALVRIEEGKIVGEWSSLVRPPTPPDPRNVEVHGLSWETLRDAPSFADVWPVVVGLLDDVDALVAHWARFDREALARNCAAEGLPGLTLPWICTVELAQRAWPQLPNRKLPTVAAHLGVELNHHDALSDARACAHIYLAALAATSPAPALPILGEERVGAEGGVRWEWTRRAGHLSLEIGGVRLLECTETSGGAATVRVFGPQGRDLLFLSLAAGAAARLDGLLLEALRVAVVAARQCGIRLAPDSWRKIVEGRFPVRRAA